MLACMIPLSWILVIVRRGLETSHQSDKVRDPFNQNSNRSDREKWSTSKGGPVFSKLLRLDWTDPLNFGQKFPEILVEWIVPKVSIAVSTLEHLLRFSFTAVRYHKTLVQSHCVHTALDILSRLRTNIHTQYIHSYFYLLKQVED